MSLHKYTTYTANIYGRMYTVLYVNVVASEVHKNELKFLLQDVIFFSLKNTFPISEDMLGFFLIPILDLILSHLNPIYNSQLLWFAI
jgi:hypothetical protein